MDGNKSCEVTECVKQSDDEIARSNLEKKIHARKAAQNASSKMKRYDQRRSAQATLSPTFNEESSTVW